MRPDLFPVQQRPVLAEKPVEAGRQVTWQPQAQNRRSRLPDGSIFCCHKGSIRSRIKRREPALQVGLGEVGRDHGFSDVSSSSIRQT